MSPIASLFGISFVPAIGAGEVTSRISVSGSGAQGNGASRLADVSADGSVIVFGSTASNLVADDTNGVEDIFVYDRGTGAITRVSVSSSGAQGNGASLIPAVSGDGRWVTYVSAATNLVEGDTNGLRDAFLHDRTTGATTRVSVTSSGQQASGESFGPALLTADGSYLVFYSYADLTGDGSFTGLVSGFRYERVTGTVAPICITTSGTESRLCVAPSISDDGRYIAFESTNSNLVLGDTNGQADIFVRDMVAGSTVRVSISSSGAQSNGGSLAASISGDGRIVAFSSEATNLVVGDTNGVQDVFVRDLASASTQRVSVGADGLQANGASRTRSFNGGSRTVSGDGRFVAFESFASNLAEADTNGVLDTFVFDRTSSTVRRVSVSSAGAQGNSSSSNVSVSADGMWVVFESLATNLVEGDTNAVRDVFARNWRGSSDFGSDKAYSFGMPAEAAFSEDPVNLATGVFTAHAEDLVLPGRVLGLAFVRWYNSADTATGPFGPAWTHTYNWKVSDAGATVEVRRGDGRRDTFTRNADGTYANPQNVFDVMTKNGDGSYTLTLTNEVRYDFSDVGSLTRISEPAGNQLSLSYTSGDLTAITDAVGRTVTLSYDAANRLTQLLDPLGRRVTYAYDASGRLVTVVDKIGNATGEDPSQHRWQYAYDGTTQHLTTITDPDGRVRVRNTYGVQGRVFEQRDGLNALATISYGSGQTTVTDPRGHQTTYTFDSRMRVLTQTDVVGASTYTLTYTYDAAGSRTSVTDRNGQRTDLTYDARGNVLTKTDPAPAVGEPRPVTTFEYDAKNNLTRILDPRAFATELTYDPLTNVLLSVRRQVDAATYAVTTYEYTDAANPGLPTRIVAPRGNTGPTPDPTYATTLAYDAQGNLSSRTDPDGATTTFAYDAAGRLSSFVDPDGNAAGGVPGEHTWTIGYDENDRETSRTDPLGNVLRYGYDGAGNRTSLTDRNGNVTSYAYDANARLSSVQQKPDPAGQPTLVYATTVARDANGNAARITQANGVITDYVFDALDRLTAVTTHPDATTSLVTSYVLDGNGQPTSRTTGDGVSITYAYDALSRLTSVSGPSLSITYAYDAAGDRTQMVDATGTTTYQYDGLGRASQVAASGGTLSYAYDLDGNRTTLGHPGGQSVAYDFSPGGRMTTVTDWATRISRYTYQPSGLVATLEYPSGLRATYAYDRAQRLTQLTNAVGGPTTVTQHTYGLDPEGNRTTLDEFVQGITPPPVVWAESTRVNDDTGPSQQDRPSIALGGDGATYLIWDDFRAGSHADIFFARRHPATGTWSANQKVNDDATNRTQWNAAVAVDGSDNAYAVWQDQRDGNKTPDTNIYASKRSASTGTWGANLRVNDDNKAVTQRDPRVAVTREGAATAVWVDFRSNQWNVYSSRLAAGATAWSANMRVTDNTSSRKELPDVAVAADGTAYAVWDDDSNGHFDVFYATLAPGATAWSVNRKVSDDPGSADQYYSRIGIDGSGNVVVVWLDDRAATTEVRMSRLSAGSSNWEASRVISDAAAIPVSTALGVRSDGNAFAAWQDARGTSYDVWGADYAASSDSWSAAILVSDDPAATAQLRPAAALNDTEVAVAWRDDRSGNADIRARRRAPQGQGVDQFTYTYDGLNRLTAVSGPVAESFTLDGATNIASRTGPSATYAHDQANRVTSDGTRTFIWDAADRLAQRGSDTFAYDPLARLTTSTVAGTTRTYSYDGDGLLRTRSDGATTRFLWDASTAPAPLLEISSDRIVHGLGPLYVVQTDGSTLTLARDALGSVRAEVSDAGALVKSFRYAAYGQIAQASAPGARPIHLGYTGELLDPSGLVYLRARWYDTGTGRFLARDTVAGDAATPATMNQYGYAVGNPVYFTDPSGRCGLLISVCVGAVIGAVTGIAGAVAQGASVRDVAIAAAVGAAGGALAGLPGAGTRMLVGAGVGAGSDLVGQLLIRPNLGAVNWGSVGGAALGGGLASIGARQTLRFGEALRAERSLVEWTAAFIGVGPSLGAPLVGGALWASLRTRTSGVGFAVGADLGSAIPGANISPAGPVPK